jgi:hypothetical protein
MFVTVETALCTVLGAFETTLCAVEVTCCTGEGDGEGDPPLPEPWPLGCEEEPELEPLLDGWGWFDTDVVDGWLEGAGDGCEVEPGGVLEDGALGAGVEAPGLEVGVVEPGWLVPVVEPVPIVVAPAVVAARGVAPDPAGR